MTADLDKALDRARRAPRAPGLGGRLWAPEVGRTWLPWQEPPAIRTPQRAAVSFSTVSTGTGSGPTATTASISISSGELAFIAVWSYEGGGAPHTPTITGWDQVGQASASDGGTPILCTVLRRVGAFSGTQAIAFSSFSQGFILWQIVKATNAKVTGTNGSDGVRQTKAANSNGGSRTNSITATLDATSVSGNALLAFSTDWDVNTLVPRTNFTALYNNPEANISTCMTAARTSGTDTAVSHTTASGTGYQSILGVEVVSATSSLSVDLTQPSETDTAQAVTKKKAKTVGQVAAANTAQAVTASKRRTLAQTTETDAPLALTAWKRVTLGQVGETDTAEAVTLAEPGVIEVTLGQADETDTPQAVTRRKTLALAQATEAETAQPVAYARGAHLGQVAETDAPLSVGKRKTKAIAQAVETDDAIALALAVLPQLAAWWFLAEHLDEGTGTLTTGDDDSQSSGGLIVAGVARGEVDNFSFPITDNKGNTFALLDQVRTYVEFPDSGTACYVADPASGGAAHHLQTTKGLFNGTAIDEVTVWGVEVKHGTRVTDIQWNHPEAGEALTSLSVTTTGPAVLIAIWWGDEYGSDSTIAANNGFTVLASELRSADQIIEGALAVKEVTEAGTYDVTWTETPDQGAQLWLIAVEAGGEISEAAEQVVETDTALAVTAAKRKTLTQPAETDAATTTTARKTKGAGQVVEADSAMAVSARKARAVGQAAESNSAMAVSFRRSVVLGQLVEIDAALAVASAKRKAVGQVSETDFALALSRLDLLLPTVTATLAISGGLAAELEPAGTLTATLEET